MCLCVVGGAGLGRYRGQGSGLGLYRGQGSGLLGSVAQGLAHPGALDMDMAFRGGGGGVLLFQRQRQVLPHVYLHFWQKILLYS